MAILLGLAWVIAVLVEANRNLMAANLQLSIMDDSPEPDGYVLRTPMFVKWIALTLLFAVGFGGIALVSLRFPWWVQLGVLVVFLLVIPHSLHYCRVINTALGGREKRKQELMDALMPASTSSFR